MRRTATLSGAALLVALLALAGCAGNNHAYRLGREAEKQGRVHTAYEYYYRAVTHDPGNPEFASSLKRVAPTAATFWDAQARIAASKGHYADAWCYSIRCIDIIPSYQSALELNDKLEAEHPKEIAPAKYNYMRYGRRSLAKAKSVDLRLASAAKPAVPRKGPNATNGKKHEPPPPVAKADKPTQLKEDRIALADPKPGPVASPEPVARKEPSEETVSSVKKRPPERKRDDLEPIRSKPIETIETPRLEQQPVPIPRATPETRVEIPSTNRPAKKPEPEPKRIPRSRQLAEREPAPISGPKPEEQAAAKPDATPAPRPELISKPAPQPAIQPEPPSVPATKKKIPDPAAPEKAMPEPAAPPLPIARAEPRSRLTPNPLDWLTPQAEPAHARRNPTDPAEARKPVPKPRPVADPPSRPKPQPTPRPKPAPKAEPITTPADVRLPATREAPPTPKPATAHPKPTASKESTPRRKTAVDVPVAAAKPQPTGPRRRSPGTPPVAHKQDKPVETRKAPVTNRPPAGEKVKKPAADKKGPKKAPVSDESAVPRKKKPAPKKIQRDPSKKKPRKSNPKAVPKEDRYLVLCTLSKGDRHYKPQAEVVEGLFLLLRDTDDEQDADIDIYDGGRRVYRFHDLKSGRSKMFRGRTGRWYRLTILNIRHRSHTVRLGINPA